MQTVEPEEIINEHDIKILHDLSINMLNIWSKEIEEKQRSRIYDNTALDAFMSVFTLMIDDFIKNKNIKNYISHVYGAPRLAIDVPIRYDHDVETKDNK